MRRLTALAIICICLPVISWGWQTVHLRRRTPCSTTARDKRHRSPGSDVPGLGAERSKGHFVARQRPHYRPTLREAQFVALVTAHPMSGQAWLRCPDNGSCSAVRGATLRQL